MDYYQMFKNWHDKASAEDIFSRFVFEYLAFIAYLMKKEYKDEILSDRNVIQKLKLNISIRDQYIQALQNDSELKAAWEKIIEELHRSPLGDVCRSSYEATENEYWNCPHESKRSKTEEEKVRPSGVIHNLHDWENMVEFIYAIRNNLFHGGKNPQDERDQLLVENGYLILRPLVELLLLRGGLMTPVQ